MFDRKNEPCRVDQILVQRRRPAPRRLSTRRAAIDLDEDGIALAGLPWRAQHLIIEVGSIRGLDGAEGRKDRSEEHTSELQSLMRISYAVFCLKKKKKHEIENRLANYSTNEQQASITYT